MDILVGEKVILLPLFLKKMTEALALTQDSLCNKAEELLQKRLEKIYMKLCQKVKDIKIDEETKSNKDILFVYRTIDKIENDTGGRQISVLYRSESILKTLDRWPYVNENDMGYLMSILNATNLFLSPYNTGIESKTIARLLSIKIQAKSNAPKVLLIKDVFLQQLEDKNTRSIFFENYLSSRERIKEVFFCYEGMYAEFDGLETIENEILMLKETENLDVVLTNILSHLTMISEAFLKPKVDSLTQNDKIKQIEEEQEFTAFNENATKYINDEMFFKIAQSLSAQLLFSIIFDAWQIFFYVCQSKNISREDNIYKCLMHELILHSLHCHKEIHLNLCASFDKWREGASL